MNRETLDRWQSDNDLSALRGVPHYGLEDEPSRLMRWLHSWSRWLFAVGTAFWLGVSIGRGTWF